MSLLRLPSSLLLLFLLSIPSPGTHGLEFSNFPLTHGRPDTVQQPRSARPTGRPDVTSGVGGQARHQEALQALLRSGEYDLGGEGGVTSGQLDRVIKGRSQNSEDQIRSRNLDRKVKTSDSEDPRRNNKEDKHIKSRPRESSRNKHGPVRSRNKNDQEISRKRNGQEISRNRDDQQLPRSRKDPQLSRNRNIPQIQRSRDDQQISKTRDIQQISRNKNIQQKSKNRDDLKTPERKDDSQISMSRDDQQISIHRDIQQTSRKNMKNLQTPRNRDDQQIPRTREEQIRLRNKNENVRSRTRGGNVRISNLQVQQTSTNRDKKNQLRGGADQTRHRISTQPRKISNDNQSNSRNTLNQPRLQASRRITSQERNIVVAVAGTGTAEQGSNTVVIEPPQSRVRQSTEVSTRTEQGQQSSINYEQQNIKLRSLSTKTIDSEMEKDANSNSKTTQRVNKGRGRNSRPHRPSSGTRQTEASKPDENFRTQLPRRQNLEVVTTSFKPKENANEEIFDRKKTRNKFRLKVSDTVTSNDNHEKAVELSSGKSVTNSYQTSNDQLAQRSRNISGRDPALSFLGRDKFETSTQQTGFGGIIEKTRTGIKNDSSVKLIQNKQPENKEYSDNNQSTSTARESNNERKRKQNKENTELKDIQSLDMESKRPITSRTRPNVEETDLEEDYKEFQSINRERQDIDTKSDVDENFRSDYEFEFEENVDEVGSEKRHKVLPEHRNDITLQYPTDKPLLKVHEKIPNNPDDRSIGQVESENLQTKPSKLDDVIKAHLANTPDSRNSLPLKPENIKDTEDTQKMKVTDNIREDAALSYDLEKALKHAELTWAADPFRNQVSLPGQAPIFDIDYSKNTAAEPTERSSVDEFPSSDNYNEKYRRPQVNTPSVTNIRYDGNIDTLAAEDDKLGNIKLIPIEALTWTPALVREKTESIEVDPRQPKRGQF